MRSRRIKVEKKNREITKSAVPQFFNSSLAIFHYFVKKKISAEFGLERRIFWCHIAIFKWEKKTLTGVFFTKCHLRCSILILAKKSFCKCFLELTNTLVFTTWELISLKFVKNLSPLIVIFEEVQASSFVIGHDREGEENCSVRGGWLVASYIMSNLRINIKPVFIQSINNKTFWQF